MASSEHTRPDVMKHDNESVSIVNDGKMGDRFPSEDQSITSIEDLVKRVLHQGSVFESTKDMDAIRSMMSILELARPIGHKTGRAIEFALDEVKLTAVDALRKVLAEFGIKPTEEVKVALKKQLKVFERTLCPPSGRSDSTEVAEKNFKKSTSAKVRRHRDGKVRSNARKNGPPPIAKAIRNKMSESERDRLFSDWERREAKQRRRRRKIILQRGHELLEFRNDPEEYESQLDSMETMEELMGDDYTDDELPDEIKEGDVHL